MFHYSDRFIKFISVIYIVLLTGCQPNDADFDNKVSEFKSTEIGTDLANSKFVPPYSSLDPLLEYTAWCNSVLWAQLSVEERSVDLAFLREEVFALAPPEVVGARGIINRFVDRSGGVDAIYPFIHGDAAYLMKPSRLAIPVIKKMMSNYQKSPSFKKVMVLSKTMPTKSESFNQADIICYKADMLTGILGGESRSRAVIREVAELVRRNTLASQ